MAWLKHVIVDILMVIVIALAALADVTAALWAVYIYTPLMLVLKIVALMGGGALAKVRRTHDAPPAWFFHAVYAASVLLLLIGGHWLLALGWLAIWVLSVLADR